MDPRAEEVSLDDIAHSLSNVCRYAGHTKTHYSVGQHSVLVSLNVPPQYAVHGLLHDAAEAYIGDISRPVKRSLREVIGSTLDDIEDRIMAAISERFGVVWTEDAYEAVKHADNLLLATEARDFMSPLHPDWHQWLNGCPVLPEPIQPWMPGRSSYEFKKRFQELKG